MEPTEQPTPETTPVTEDAPVNVEHMNVEQLHAAADADYAASAHIREAFDEQTARAHGAEAAEA